MLSIIVWLVFCLALVICLALVTCSFLVNKIDKEMRETKSELHTMSRKCHVMADDIKYMKQHLRD